MCLTVLLIEDDDALRETLREMLSREGYRVIEARSGAEAREALSGKDRLALVITDIRLPDTDGFALIEETRDVRPGVPVLAMTGGDTMRTAALRSEAYLSAATHVGASRTLSKPFRLDELLTVVRELLGE